nr:hypothetical protein [uncultured Lichenicoccus sp.]
MSHDIRVPSIRSASRRLLASFWTDATGREASQALRYGLVFSRRQRWMLLLGFALLVIFRLPHAWTYGRFQDEEATVFLAYAWHRPWLDALFRPFAGYWNLAANATTLLVAALVKGGVVSLETAPYLTMTMALAVQLLPAVLILTGWAPWLAGRMAVIAALLFVAMAPSTEEVFLNVLHIQFHLALCVALILALDVPRRRIVQAGYGVLLFLAPLCGPGAIVLLPLVALRGLIDRDMRRLAQLAVLAAGAAVQLLLFYGSSPVRGGLHDPWTIAAALFVRLIALPTLGGKYAREVAVVIHGSQLAGGNGWRWFGAATVALFGFLIVEAARRRDAAVWLLLAGVSLASASFGFGFIAADRFSTFSPLAAERYDFLPLVLLGLALVALAMRPGFFGRPVYALLCAVMLVTAVIQYPHPEKHIARGPSWAAEVATWRRDHRHPLSVWPLPWTADLSDETRSCSPVGRDPGRTTDPQYCESGWVAGIVRAQQKQ